jgi:hypothetical protein
MKSLRTLLLIAGIIVLITLGIFKEDWLELWAQWLVLHLSGNTQQGSSGILDFLLTNRKFLATSLMSLLYLTITSGSIWMYTRSKFWTSLSAGLIIFLMSLSLLIYLLGLKVGQTELWWKTAQDIKMLIQSPFILIILAGAYLWLKQQKS